jgi:glycosyltransferase involved in cell wall biosynthesis
MNILQFTLPHHPSMGGIYTGHEDFRNILKAPIVEVMPSTLWGQTKGDYQIKISGVGFIEKYGLPINVPEIIAKLHELKIDLVIIHSLFHIHSLIGYWFAKQKNIPYLFVPHGTLDPYVFSYRSTQKLFWMSMLGQKLIDNSSAVICSTPREAEKAAKYLQKANIEICPWGIHTPDIVETSVWREEIRNKLNISSNQRLLIFLGRLNRVKRVVETALAFQKLKPKNWTLLLVGPPEETQVMKDVEDICDGQTICYHPPVNSIDKWKFLAAADAFINLSYKENFGYSVAEAAFIGLPILISSGVDIYPMLQSVGAAHVISISSEYDISDGISQFLSKPLLELQNMGLKAKAYALDNFMYNSFGEKLKIIVSKYTNF